MVLFVLASISSIYAAEKKYKLTLGDSTAPVGLRGEAALLLLEEIEKHTNGRVEVEVFWGESLLKAKEILKGVQEGIVDIGYLNPNYYPEKMFVNGSFAVLPQGPTRFITISKVYNRIYDEFPIFEKELEALNQKTIYRSAVLPLAVVSTKPFTSYESFKGKRVRAASRWWLAELEGAGSVPVSIPWGDCYMALQTGTIDAVFTNFDGEHRTKLDEPGHHVFTLKEIWYAIPMIYTINLDKFNSLPVDIRAELIAAGKAAEKRFSEVYSRSWDEIIKEQKEMGCTITNATSEDIQKWTSMPVIAELQEQWIKDAQSRGIDNADEIITRMKEIIAEETAK